MDYFRFFQNFFFMRFPIYLPVTMLNAAVTICCVTLKNLFFGSFNSEQSQYCSNKMNHFMHSFTFEYESAITTKLTSVGRKNLIAHFMAVFCVINIKSHIHKHLHFGISAKRQTHTCILQPTHPPTCACCMYTKIVTLACSDKMWKESFVVICEIRFESVTAAAAMTT